MNRFIYYIAALATVAFAGCSQDVEGLDATASTQKEVRFAVSIDPTTRVALDDAALTWEYDDQLYLYRLDEVGSNSSNSLSIDSSSISDDKKYAEFTASFSNDFVDGAKYVAISKQGWYSSDYEAYEIEMYHQSQSSNGSDSHIEDGLLLMSQVFTYDASQESITTLQFSIEQSVLALDLKLDSDIADSYQIAQASISSDNYNFMSWFYLFSDGTIGAGKNTFEDIQKEISVDLGDESTISSSEPYKLYIPVFWADDSTVSGNFKVSLKTIDGKVTMTEFAAKELCDGTIYTKSLVFGEAEENTGEKEILLKVYDAMGGSDWICGDDTDSAPASYESGYDYAATWNMETPLSEWAGIELNGAGYVTYIEFDDVSNMTASLPYDMLAELSALENICIDNCDMPLTLEGISALKNLQGFSIGDMDTFVGSIPDEFYSLEKLAGLEIDNVNISGTLSEKISNFKDLAYLYINNTDMSGSIPSSITTLTKLEEVDLSANKFSGTIPAGLLSMNISDLHLPLNNFTSFGNAALYANQELWNKYAVNILTQNEGYGFDDSFRNVYLEEETFDISGSSISTSEYFKQNDYTLIVSYDGYSDVSKEMFYAAQSAYRAYGAAGLGLVTYYNSGTMPNDTLGDINNNYDSCYSEYLAYSGAFHILVDKDGKIVSNPYITEGYTFDYDSFFGGGDERKSSVDMLESDLSELFKDAAPYFALSETKLTAPSMGGTATIKVLTNASWSVTESSDWITSVSKTSGSGSAEIDITFTKNTTGAARKTTMTFTNSAGEPVVLDVIQGISMLDDFEEEQGL